jgi:ferredoxin-NADP reductase
LESHIVKILNVNKVTHDVKRFEVEKPDNYKFVPGQATEISINKKGYEELRRPFTFTSLNEWENLEFIIKIYKNHNGFTKMLDSLEKGDELIIHDVWGEISYKGDGIFIAGGAGITPFIAILRELEKNNRTADNKLIFANKTKADIILEKELKSLLKKNFINILSEEKSEGYKSGFINEELIKTNLNGNKGCKFYICGPTVMMEAVEKQLENLKINKTDIIKEGF